METRRLIPSPTDPPDPQCSDSRSPSLERMGARRPPTQPYHPALACTFTPTNTQIPLIF
ncbi:MAG: hypothetical protein J2P37_28510 [Ktedonobacteraceae bacterium]|nr:hypothetical protein [Ktedonobacteraceae bacterium]